jgi:hypothetical protein
MPSLQEICDESRSKLKALQQKSWTQTDKATLEELYITVRKLRDRGVDSTITDIETGVYHIRSITRHTHYISPMKKILIGITFAFLSASTVRYWMGKVEPMIENYIQQRQSSVEQKYFANIDRILYGQK